MNNAENDHHGDRRRPSDTHAVRRRILAEGRDRALDACHRLEKFYDCVKAHLEAPGEAGEERATGLWLLAVMEGWKSDGKPYLEDPDALWEEVLPLVDEIKAERSSPLPELTFASPADSDEGIRRKEKHFAIAAALYAQRLLLEELSRFRTAPSTELTLVAEMDPRAEAAYDWDAVCEWLGPCGGGHFADLSENVRVESHAARDFMERLWASTPPDGPQLGSVSFWWGGAVKDMPGGDVAEAIRYLWDLPDRSARLEDFVLMIWGEDTDVEEAVEGKASDLRRHANEFFCGFAPLKLTMSKKRRTVSIVQRAS